MPDVTGMDEADAKSTLSALGLVVNISYANSDTVPNGKVISQSITGSKAAKKGDSVAIVVSSGETLFAVPNVIGSDRASAEAALKNAGFSVMVDEQYSETVAAGQVISQSETPGTNIKKNSTVLIVVSKGAQMITVPNVVGKDSDSAVKAMTDSGLSVSTVQQSSDTVAAGKVISQSVGAGTSVKPGTPVTLVISSGVEKVTVPNVVGSALSNAQNALSSCGLSASVSEQYSDNVAAGVVISQSVAAGSSVNKGSNVGIVVSRGPENAGVPNVIGSDRSAAISALQAAGFNVSEGEAQYSDSVPAGCVISQDVAGGSQVKKGTTVTIIVSKGQEMVTVPNVTGMDAASAESKLAQSGLNVARGTAEYSDIVPEGNVISQSVSSGSSVAKGSTVTIIVSKGVSSYTVTFDSNGGTSVNSMSVKKGGTLSGLPTPTKDYCNFAGWTYNGSSAEGMTVNGDMTLIANWTDKAAGDWVLANNAPSGGKVVDNKWTYTVTTTETTWSTEAALDGWTRTGNVTQQEAGSGVIEYIETQPSGFQNTNGLMVGTPSGWDNDTSTRVITKVKEFKEYYYWHYTRTKEYYGWGREDTGNYIGNKPAQGNGDSDFSNYNEYRTTFGGSNWDGKAGSGTDGWGTYFNLGALRLPFNPYVSMWFYRADIYNAYYTDYVKSFEYAKTTVESRESTTGEPSGAGVGNIQHWVRYIPK